MAILSSLPRSGRCDVRNDAAPAQRANLRIFRSSIFAGRTKERATDSERTDCVELSFVYGYSKDIGEDERTAFQFTGEHDVTAVLAQGGKICS